MRLDRQSRILDLVLDKQSTVPLYLQLKHHIVHLISSGEYQPGSPLPSVRQLSSALGLAAATIQRTYCELQTQGRLVGQTGRGVFVAELTAGMPDLAGERSDVLRNLLGRSVTHARSLGFRDDEIHSTVEEFVNCGRVRATLAAPRVVLVAPRTEFAEKYRAELSEVLSASSVTVEAILLGELEARGDAMLDSLEPIACLISLVSTFPDLRRLAGHRGTPLYGLVVDLSEETQCQLMELPDDTIIGLVAEDENLASARALVRHYRESEAQMLWVGHHNPKTLRRILRECPIILHTLGSNYLLEGRAPPSTRLVEFRFRPNAASLARLRALLEGKTTRRVLS